jgi:hypothetical protein
MVAALSLLLALASPKCIDTNVSSRLTVTLSQLGGAAVPFKLIQSPKLVASAPTLNLSFWEKMRYHRCIGHGHIAVGVVTFIDTQSPYPSTQNDRTEKIQCPS